MPALLRRRVRARGQRSPPPGPRRAVTSGPRLGGPPPRASGRFELATWRRPGHGDGMQGGGTRPRLCSRWRGPHPADVSPAPARLRGAPCGGAGGALRSLGPGPGPRQPGDGGLGAWSRGVRDLGEGHNRQAFPDPCPCPHQECYFPTSPPSWLCPHLRVRVKDRLRVQGTPPQPHHFWYHPHY